MEFIEKLVNNSTFYYVLIGVVYVLCIIFVVMLLVKGKRKKNIEKVDSKKDLDAVDLESVLEKMQEEVNKPKDEIMTFEEEQEEKAIISYQELLNAVKKNASNPVAEKQTEVTSKSEVVQEKNYLEPVILKTEKEDKVEDDQPKLNKFQNSEFISPIFGRLDNDIEYPKIKSFEEKNENEDLEKTIILPKVSEKLDNNDEFLRILKEFRNNLE